MTQLGTSPLETVRRRLPPAASLLVACVLAAGPAAGQEPGWKGKRAAADPLAGVVEEALRGDPRLVQARLAEARAGAEVRAARARYFPSLTLGARYTEQNGTLNLGDVVNPANAALNELLGERRFATDVDVTLPYAHEARVRLVQPVFDAAIRAGHDAAKHAHAASGFARVATARTLAAEAQAAFLRHGAAAAARAVWEATVERAVESERIAGRRVGAGTATPDAVFRARADRSEVEQRLEEAREAENAARRAFNRVVGRPFDAPVMPLDEADLLLDLPVDRETALVRALSGRAEVRQVGAAIEGAEAGVRVATASLLPAVSLALDYGFQSSDLRFTGDADFWSASLVLSWNLFNGGASQARRSGAQADVGRLRAQRREVEDLVRLDVLQAFEAATVARAAIGTAGDRLAAARRTFDLVRRRWEEGLATPIEFLDARTELTSAELNRVVTLYRFAIRRVDLERAAALRDLEGRGAS